MNTILSSDLNFEQEFVAAKHELTTNIDYIPSNNAQKNRKRYLCSRSLIFPVSSKSIYCIFVTTYFQVEYTNNSGRP